MSFLQGKRVLVVDDSSVDRKATRDILVKFGATVTEAVDGEAGVEKAKSELPDLIIMDVVMPVMAGFEATRNISRNESTKHIPIIICSTKNQSFDVDRAAKSGAKDHVSKPVQDGKELIAKITKVMGL